MSTEGMTAHEYRGIKRIQQACTNCRRKKAKCSGERPVCGYCKRLSQPCQWESGTGVQSNTLQRNQDHAVNRTAGEIAYNSVNDVGLGTRVAAIESKLDALMSTVNALLPTLAQGNNPVPSTNNSDSIDIPDAPTPPSTAPTGDFESTTSSFQDLPPPQVIADLVNVYFTRVHNQPYSFFHEENFRQRQADGLLPDYLIFAVLATSLRFSDDPYYNGARLEACAAYASSSWKRIVMSWFVPESDPNIYICQAVTLLSIIDSTSGRRHPAWLKIGLSVRIAQDLRLMMEPDSSLSISDQEERRRVFWSIYILDRFCSCGRAMPSAILDAHCRVQLPCDETTFRNGIWKRTSTLDKLLSSGDANSEHPGHLAMVVLTACIIGRCAQHAIHEYRGEDARLPPWDSKSEFAMIYSKLLQLETNFEMGRGIGEALSRDCVRDGIVDMQIAGPLVVSNAIFHICQVLLHHPFLLYHQAQKTGVKIPPSFISRALLTCREHASSMSRLLQETRDAGCLTYFSFLGYCTTVASGVHILYLHNEDHYIQKCAREFLQSDLAFLQEFSQHWKNGGTMVEILQSLSRSALASSSLVRASPQEGHSLDPSLTEDLWASVDNSTMSQSVRAFSTPIYTALSPDFNSLFGLSIPEGHRFDPDNFLPAPIGLSSEAAYSHAMNDSMSPMSSFFNGNPSLNFGS